MKEDDYDLAAAIRAAIDETERVARAAAQENWRWYAEDKTVITLAADNGEWAGYRPTGTRADAEHIARHDPATVLRRCAADRKLLDDYESANAQVPEIWQWETREGGYASGLLTAVHLLAEAYDVPTDTPV